MNVSAMKSPPVQKPAPAVAPPQTYVKYVPVGFVSTHSIAIGYLLWLIGFTGAHRFYYGKPITGVIWFLTLGLLGMGWIVDAFLIPGMCRQASQRYLPGPIDYSLAWVLLIVFGWLGIHRFYQGKILTGILFALTGGLLGLGYIYDVLSLNEQICERNARLTEHYC